MAKYPFERIEKIDDIEIEDNLNIKKLPWFVEELINSRGIDLDDLRKIYYLCFYSSSLDVELLMSILNQTHDNSNLSIDFIYDWYDKTS